MKNIDFYGNNIRIGIILIYVLFYTVDLDIFRIQLDVNLGHGTKQQWYVPTLNIIYYGEQNMNWTLIVVLRSKSSLSFSQLMACNDSKTYFILLPATVYYIHMHCNRIEHHP